MNVKKTAVKIIICLLLLSALGFIWGHSVADIPASRAESQHITELVRPILEPIMGPGNVTDHLVRKIAHFVEFFVLGCVLAGISLLCSRRFFPSFAFCLAAGLTAGAVDETIQLFSGRGAMIADVLLDFCGGSCGSLAVLGITHLVCAIRWRRF